MSRRLNVYFIHAAWLKDRERIISEFQKLTSKYTFKNIKGVKIRTITDYDPMTIDSSVISRTVQYSPIPAEEGQLTIYNNFLKNMHVFQLSNTLKFYKVFEEIAQHSSDDDLHLILEDDVLFEDKICMTIEKQIADLPSNFDLVFLGFPTNLDANTKNNTKYQPTKDVFPMFPYCDSFFVSKNAAKKIFDNYLPIRFTNNIQLSYVCEKIGLKSVLAIPNIFMDGSKFGVFLGTLTPSNQLMFNPDYMKIRGLLSKESLAEEDINSIESTYNNCIAKNHPDMMHVYAVFLAKINKLDESKKVFESALQIFQNNNCIVNHESQFLKDYIRLHRETQEIP
jgi:GR25 family glycosyltransferase involved in LPS biosynthesis